MEGLMQELIFAVGAIFVVSVIAGIVREIRRKRRLAVSVAENWGRPPENDFDQSDMKNFSQLFNLWTRKVSGKAIDDTTWNDLEMDNFYAHINSTLTSMGDNVLYSMLRTPLLNREPFQDRVDLVNYWTGHKKEREKIMSILANAGKFSPFRVDVLVDDAEFLEINNRWVYRILTFVPLLAVPVMFFSLEAGILLMIAAMGINVLYHVKLANSIQFGLEAITQASRMVTLARTLLKNRVGDLNDRFDRLDELYGTLKPMMGKASLNAVTSGFSGNMGMDFISIINMVFLIDIWNYQTSIRFIRAHHEEFAQLIEAIGELDATLCAASYRESLETCCKPEIIWNNEDMDLYIDAEDVVHPLIENCVPNPVYSSRATLLTGSNASGKSTYLKTVGINTIMAHTLGFCLARRWRSRPLFTITSMALRDSVLNGESYFIAEIKSLKRIFSMVNNKVTCLCIVDEVLRGTNTIERIAASSRLLYSLYGENACIFAATHDVELTHILSRYFENRHFEEKVTDDDIEFDYLIKDGRATTRNAIKLLKTMGFNEDIIRDANKAVEDFEMNHSWTQIGSTA